MGKKKTVRDSRSPTARFPIARLWTVVKQIGEPLNRFGFFFVKGKILPRLKPVLVLWLYTPHLRVFVQISDDTSSGSAPAQLNSKFLWFKFWRTVIPCRSNLNGSGFLPQLVNDLLGCWMSVFFDKCVVGFIFKANIYNWIFNILSAVIAHFIYLYWWGGQSPPCWLLDFS